MYFFVKRDAGHHTRCSFDSRLPSSWYVCCKIVLRLGNNQSHCSKGATRTKQKAGDPNRRVRRVSHLWNSMQNSMSTLRYLFRRPSNPQSEVMSGIVAELLWLIQRFHTPKLIKIPAAKQLQISMISSAGQWRQGPLWDALSAEPCMRNSISRAWEGRLSTVAWKIGWSHRLWMMTPIRWAFPDR